MSAPRRAERDSSLELLRILCMFFIVIGHICNQGGIARYDTLAMSLKFSAISSYARIGSMAFVFIGSWFLCQSPFRARRPLQLWIKLWLYTVPFTLLAWLLAPALGLEVTLGTLRWALFPASTNQLWFISAYLLLLLLSPLLNAAMTALPRSADRAILLVTGALLVGYATLFAEPGLVKDDVWTFLYAYMLIFYLRRWPDNRLTAFLQRRGAALAVGVGVPAVITAARALAVWRGLGGKALQYAEAWRDTLCTLPVLLPALALFYLFKGMRLGHSRAVNAIAAGTPGVYILHQMPAWLYFWWNGLFHCADHPGSALYGLFVTLAFFAGAAAFDLAWTRIVLRPMYGSALFQRVCARWDAAFEKSGSAPGTT